MMFISEQQDAIVIALLSFLMKPVTLRPRVNRKRKHAEGSNTSGSIEENYINSSQLAQRPSISEIQESMVVIVPVSTKVLAE